MNLPTTWITVESVGTVIGMAVPVFLVLMLVYVVGGDRTWRLVFGFGAAFVLHEMLALSSPDVTVLSVVLAVYNAILSLLTAWLLHVKAIPIWDKLI